jgi:hypothetical protein
VYSAAGDRMQARVVFNEAKWQISQSPALSGICKVYRDVVEVPSLLVRSIVCCLLTQTSTRSEPQHGHLMRFTFSRIKNFGMR